MNRAHEAIVPDMPPERDIRSMLKSITRLMRTATGKRAEKLLAEHKRLAADLKVVVEAKRQILEAQLAEIESGKNQG